MTTKQKWEIAVAKRNAATGLDYEVAKLAATWAYREMMRERARELEKKAAG